RVLVNKLVYHVRGIARGDIVVFSGDGSWGTTTGEPDPSPPGNPLLRVAYDVLAYIGVYSRQTYYIKRVIGLPGDHVVCCVNGKVTVNGVALNEKSYLFPGARPSMQPFNLIERLHRRPRAGEQVGLLVQRHAVDRDLAVHAAHHVIAGQPDDSLDVVGLPAVYADIGEHVVGDPQQRVTWRGGIRLARGGAPRAVPAEHHDVAAGDAADVVDQLVDQHPVAGEQGVLHRGRGDPVHLDHERLDEQHQDDGRHHDHHQLAPGL